MYRKQDKGFSLIELVIAIAIMVILTGLLVPQFTQYIEKSRETRDVQAMNMVYTAVQGAMANEEAYQDLQYLYAPTKSLFDKIQTSGGVRLTDVINEDNARISAFCREVRTLVGERDIELISRSAGDGDIYINIMFNGGASGSGNNLYSGGFEVTVYCGDGTKRIGTLEAIGNNAP